MTVDNRMDLWVEHMEWVDMVPRFMDSLLMQTRWNHGVAVIARIDFSKSCIDALK